MMKISIHKTKKIMKQAISLLPVLNLNIWVLILFGAWGLGIGIYSSLISIVRINGV
jgi:hypothetical protein